MTENQSPHVHFCPKTWKIPTKTKKYLSQEPFLSMECSVQKKIETSPGQKAKLTATASTKCCGKKLPQHPPTRCSLTLYPGLLSSTEKPYHTAGGGAGSADLLPACAPGWHLHFFLFFRAGESHSRCKYSVSAQCASGAVLGRMIQAGRCSWEVKGVEREFLQHVSGKKKGGQVS